MVSGCLSVLLRLRDCILREEGWIVVATLRVRVSTLGFIGGKSMSARRRRSVVSCLTSIFGEEEGTV